MQIVETELSANEVKELKEIFGLFDTDGGGTISYDELGRLLETVGTCLQSFSTALFSEQ